MRTLALGLASLVLFLGLGELVTRLLDRGGRIYDLETYRYSRLLTQPAGPDLHHLQVPGASAELSGVEVRINAHGLRDRDYPYDVPAGVKRLVLLGDSVSFGWGVPQDRVYAKVAEAELCRTGKYELINGAVVNYTTSRMLAFYRDELSRYHARVVLLAFFLNNANDAAEPGIRSVLDTPLELPVFVYSRLRRVLAHGPDFDAFHAALYADDNPAFIAFRDRVTAFVHQLTAEGKTVVVVNVPDALHLDEPAYRYQPITDKVLGLARAAGARTVDLLPAVKGVPAREIVNSAEDRHPNAEGHRRMGVYLAAELRKLGI